MFNASEEVRFTFYSIVSCKNGDHCCDGGVSTTNIYISLFGHHVLAPPLPQVDFKIIVIIQYSNKLRPGAGIVSLTEMLIIHVHVPLFKKK